MFRLKTRSRRECVYLRESSIIIEHLSFVGNISITFNISIPTKYKTWGNVNCCKMDMDNDKVHVSCEEIVSFDGKTTILSNIHFFLPRSGVVAGKYEFLGYLFDESK